MFRCWCIFLVPIVTAATGAMPAQAQTLEEALVAGYLSNPTLLQQRANLRATNESVVQALSDWRPDISLSGSYGYSHSSTSSSPASANGSLFPVQAQLEIRQNLYKGGQTQNAIAAAEHRIKAGQAILNKSEHQVLLGIVTAYFDVSLEREVVELGRKTSQLLERQLQSAEDRFEVGEITRTDVAQAKARLAQAYSNLSQSERDLVIAEANYMRFTGQHPGTLEKNPPLPPLPASQEEALALAMQHAPDLKISEYNTRAARYDTEIAKGAFLPVMDLIGQYQYGRSMMVSGQSRNTFSLTARVSLPLYQRGAASSRVRQRASIHAAERMNVRAMERLVRANVRSAWEQLRSVRARIVSDERQVAANEVAFEGISREAEAGLRTTLDILDGEQELFDSRVSLSRSRRDEYVAVYSLLQAIGKMSARDLQLSVDYYDPSEQYQRIRGRWFGYDGHEE